MGMPISSYTVLNALAKGGDGYEMHAAKRALAPFSLFAFVIHDPEIHDEFDRHLAHIFDRLDFDTGRRLLFLALVKPSAEWLAHAQSRDYYGRLSSWEASEFANPAKSPAPNDPAATAIGLAHALGIPTEALPCIVVTRSFELKQFAWAKTSPSELREQLSELGYWADRHPGAPILQQTPSPVSIRSKAFESGALNTSLAQALADVLCFVVAGNKGEPWLQGVARQQARQTLDRLWRQIAIIKSKTGQDDLTELDRLCVCIAAFLSQLAGGDADNRDCEIWPDVNRRKLEGESFVMLRTAERVFRLLGEDPTAEAPRLQNIPGMAEADFTPGVICLAKTFENEINLSVVHWIRQGLGIQLPEFFNRPQKDVRAVYVPNILDGQEIDFNRGLRGKWLPPGIGQSELVCSEMGRESIPPDISPQLWGLLLQKWRTIRTIRNQAAHAELVTRESMLQVRTALQDLFSKHLFAQTDLMKRRYRGIL